MTDTMRELAREAFEHWYSDEGKNPETVKRNGEHYKLMQAQISWITWQAAWEAAAPPVKDKGE